MSRLVLYINRDPAKAERAGKLLLEHDYRLVSACGFPEAEEKLAQRQFSFVIYDVRVILEEGAAGFLQMKAAHPHLPVVAASPIFEGEPEKTSESKFD